MTISGALGSVTIRSHRWCGSRTAEVVVEKRRCGGDLVLGQDVDAAVELGVRRGGAGLTTTWPRSTSSRLMRAAADRRCCWPARSSSSRNIDTVTVVLVTPARADDHDSSVHVDDAALDVTGHDGATTGDGEDVLDGIRNGLSVSRTGSGSTVRSASIRSSTDSDALGVARGPSADTSTTGASRRSLQPAQQLADLQLDELDEAPRRRPCRPVQRNQDVGHADRDGRAERAQGWGMGPSVAVTTTSCAVDLGGTGDHVLDVVSVTGGVDVRVVTLLGLQLTCEMLMVIPRGALRAHCRWTR